MHAVTDSMVVTLPGFDALARSIAVSSTVALHARLPKADGARVQELAQRLAAANHATVLVNDRVDVARIANAAGVHLPANGLPTKAARKLLASEQLLGRSVHGIDEARRAFDDGADYVFLGPIWETSSHPGQKPLGLEALKKLAHLPVIAIGGVTPARAVECHTAGAWGVAAISALWKAPDPGAAVRSMLLSFEAQ